MRIPALALTLLAACAAPAEHIVPEGFVPLFNGKDLSGWTDVYGAPGTWSVRDGMMVCAGVPMGVLRSDRVYENFILELEWRHTKPAGNSGLFLHADPLPACGQPFPRGIEVQIKEDNHGDIFPIHKAAFTPDPAFPKRGARSLPVEARARPRGEWNHYRVESRDGAITLAVNGKIVSGGSKALPRCGYLALESEGSEAHFRNLRIQELHSSSPPPEQIAERDSGFVPLFDGIDLSAWKKDPDVLAHWTVKNGLIECDGLKEAKNKNLWTEKEYGDFVLIADWRLPMKPEPRKVPLIQPNGEDVLTENGKTKHVEISDDAGDSGIYLRGSPKSQINIFCWPIGSGEVYGYRKDPAFSPEVHAGVTPKLKADNPPGKWNRFVITMKGDRLTVVLNGKTVIENAQLPGVAPRGPIALQHYGFPVEFANLFIKEF